MAINRRINICPGGNHAAGCFYIVLANGFVERFLDIGIHKGEVTNRAQWQLCVDYTIFPTTYKQETLRDKVNAKEKAALQAAELLVVDLAKEAEAQPGILV
jgi:hypothetical protein